jgi:hypothetical protein
VQDKPTPGWPPPPKRCCIESVRRHLVVLLKTFTKHYVSSPQLMNC